MTKARTEPGPWWYYWGAWTLLGLFMATMDIPAIVWWKALLGNLVQYLFWGVLSLCTLWLLRRFPLGYGQEVRWRNWGIHLAASALVTCAALFVTLVGFHFLKRFSFHGWYARSIIADYLGYLQNLFHYNLFTYWAVVGIREALDLQRRARARELQAAQLEARLSAAQLQALRMQLQPHFLFNTLNAVTALMRRDVRAAETMLVRLGELLRLTLEEKGGQEVNLERELALLGSYLEIETIRFQGRLSSVMEIQPGLQGARVPSFILQPLVENALKHGLADKVEGGRLVVRATTQDGQLCLEVEDDGAGLPPGGLRMGVGLSNTRSRMEGLYGSHQRLDLLPRPGGGTLVRALLPLAWAEDAP